MPAVAHFWASVSREGECWEWKRARSANGYGRTGKSYAHRVAYELTHGRIPAGLDVMHSCDNRLCCNPAHLSVGTRAENMQDAARKGRIRGGGPRRFDRDEARRLLASGLGLRATARALGVTHSSVAKALGRP